MPNRILKESICTSDSIDSLSWFEEVLFYRLMVNCDDYGRFDGRTAVVKNRLFPLKDNVTLKNVESAINKLVQAGLVSLYVFEGKPFMFLPTWNEHQNIRAKKSKYPAPDDGVNTSEYICKQMNTSASICSRNPIQSESESNPNTNVVARFAPPTVEEVFEYCVERKNAVDPQRFVDFYTSKGWMVGKTKMKDWKAAVRNWEKTETKENPLNMGVPKNIKAPATGESMAQYTVAFRKKVADEQ
jgi:hypothetical protein